MATSLPLHIIHIGTIFAGSVLLLLTLNSCEKQPDNRSLPSEKSYEIAFMPDVHFHDVFAQFEPGSFEGLPVTYQEEERQAVIRTMEAQLTSTRLFNENYFAFLAALDDAVGRGIKLIALPGDFSDDGQPAHVRGLMQILSNYRDEHGISFFLTPGNHDPGRPFEAEAGKPDYLGQGGRRQPVYSNHHPRCQNQDMPRPLAHTVACTDEVKELGYAGLYDLISEFGLRPDAGYHYYETPFSRGLRDQSAHNPGIFEPESRLYEICREGSGGKYRQQEYTNCFDIMDMSYLVEPMEDLWLLALDTNIYIPAAVADTLHTAAPSNFSGSGNTGFNKVITHKKHLVEWMEDVARRADEMGKTLISFSHFPAADFYNGAGAIIEQVWGENEFQMVRLPSQNTTEIVARTGIGLHVAGHMHMNGIEIAEDEASGRMLTNIQVPSIAAYAPAYKIIRTSGNPKRMEVETVRLDNVAGFDTFFPLYETEWNFLDSLSYKPIWNRQILQSASYQEFTDWHIRELSRLRFLPREWPGQLQEVFESTSGRELLIFSQINQSISLESAKAFLKGHTEGMQTAQTPLDAQAWKQATMRAETLANDAGIDLTELANWSGGDLSIDFYRLRNAGDLALRDITAARMAHYRLLWQAYEASSASHTPLPETGSAGLHIKLTRVFEVMMLFADRPPSYHIRIDLESGKITPLS